MLLCGVGKERSAELGCCTDDKSLKYMVCGDHIVEFPIGLDVAGELATIRDTLDGVCGDKMAECLVRFRTRRFSYVGRSSS